MFLSRTATRGQGHFGESGFWNPHTLTYHHAKFQKGYILCRIVRDSSSARIKYIEKFTFKPIPKTDLKNLK